MNENKKKQIPFGKPARIGNFKVWRSIRKIGRGKSADEIEQINISTLDGDWQVKVPSTFAMFSMLGNLFSESDGDMADQRIGQLLTFFVNMFSVCCINNGYFQRAVNICAAIYANPSLLNEDDERHAGLMLEVKDLISGFLAWRKDYDAIAATDSAKSDDELDNEQVAEEMLSEIADAESQSTEK